jgi:hypothetical protein
MQKRAGKRKSWQFCKVCTNFPLAAGCILLTSGGFPVNFLDSYILNGVDLE